MRTTLVFFFLGCLLNVQTNAQDGFVIKTNGTYSFNFPHDLVIKPNNNMLFLFTSIPQPPLTIYSNEIRELNPFGETVNAYIFDDTLSNYVEMHHCLMVQDTLYVFGWGYMEEKSVNAFLIMHKLDLQLNVLNSYKFDFEELYPFPVNHGKVHYHAESFEYICSYGGSYEKLPIHIELSKNGELINFEVGGEPGKKLIPYDFSIKPQGGYQMFCVSGDYIGPSLLAGLICNFNPNFQLESFYQLPYDFISFFTHKAYNDTIYFLSGQWLDITSSPPFRGGVLKMKNDTTILDEFLYSTYPDTTACPAYRNSIEILSDGNFIYCFTSNIEIQLVPQGQPAKINLMKLTPDFEVIWHRYIGELDKKYDAYKMHTNEANEIVILGACSQAQPGINQNMDVLLIKTTPDGLITGINDEMPEIRSTETLLYPNPAKEFVMVEFSRAYREATLAISNLNGQEVFKTRLTAYKQQVDISMVPAGNYVYRIFNEKGLDEGGKLVLGR